VPLTLVAGMGHWLLGSVDWSMLLSLLLGSLPGIVIGSLLSARAPERLLRNLLAATLVAVGVRLVLA
ncbi:TSUP family transporter, partial [Burkholderia multivorans]|nr:TSUP family transporter [Burkholderia multivorans]